MPDLRELNAEELERFVEDRGGALIEEEALLVLENGFCTAGIAQRIAQDARLTSWYTVRAALVRLSGLAKHGGFGSADIKS